MLEFIFEAFLLATVSWFYHVTLKDYLLADWFEYGYEHFGKEKYDRTWRKHLYMPIWGCQYCTSGQFALWYFFILYDHYSIIAHITFITLTVLFTKIIWKYLEQ